MNKDQLNQLYSNTCAQIGDLEVKYQVTKNQLLAQIDALGKQMQELENAEITPEPTPESEG